MAENQVLFTVKKDKDVGRYAVASVDLKAADLIFAEKPFAYGPKADSPPLCLGCLSPVDCTVLCTKCNWPVCGPDCEQLPTHRDNECAVFAKANVKFQPVEDPTQFCPQYECITTLRVLLEKERNEKRWKEEVEIMEAHNDIRKTKEIWQYNQTNIVDYLRGPCKLDRFPAELIHTIIGILEVNAFEARTSLGYLIRCLYPKLAILSHNCVSNITHTIDSNGNGQFDDYEVRVRAAVDVGKDEQLYSSYTYSLWPTLVRREFLSQSKYFDCKCKRCSDKTELGTHMSTLKCQKCDNGVILSTNPLDDTCEWKCTHCEFKTSAQAVRKVFATVQDEIEQIEYMSSGEGIQLRETLYKKYKSVFHPKNAYLTILRTGLTQLYGRAEGYTVEELPDLLLERKIEFCNQLLEVLDVIEPGHTRLRGITLYELHSPMMILARNQYNNDVISKEIFRKRMEEAVSTLGKSVEILKHESATSPEGQLGVVAQQAFDALTANFDLMIETA